MWIFVQDKMKYNWFQVKKGNSCMHIFIYLSCPCFNALFSIWLPIKTLMTPFTFNGAKVKCFFSSIRGSDLTVVSLPKLMLLPSKKPPCLSHCGAIKCSFSCASTVRNASGSLSLLGCIRLPQYREICLMVVKGPR